MPKSTTCSHCGEQSMPSDYYCWQCKTVAKLLSQAVKQERMTPWQQQELWRRTYHSSAQTKVLLDVLRGK